MRLPALVTQVDVDAAQRQQRGGDAGRFHHRRRGLHQQRLPRLARPAGRAPGRRQSKWSVVNAGIGGNRLLRYGTGPSALARLDRDVLSVPGVKAIILLEGINDIGRGFTPDRPAGPGDAWKP